MGYDDEGLKTPLQPKSFSSERNELIPSNSRGGSYSDKEFTENGSVEKTFINRLDESSGNYSKNTGRIANKIPNTSNNYSRRYPSSEIEDTIEELDRNERSNTGRRSSRNSDMRRNKSERSSVRYERDIDGHIVKTLDNRNFDHDRYIENSLENDFQNYPRTINRGNFSEYQNNSGIGNNMIDSTAQFSKEGGIGNQSGKNYHQNSHSRGYKTPYDENNYFDVRNNTDSDYDPIRKRAELENNRDNTLYDYSDNQKSGKSLKSKSLRRISTGYSVKENTDVHYKTKLIKKDVSGGNDYYYDERDVYEDKYNRKSANRTSRAYSGDFNRVSTGYNYPNREISPRTANEESVYDNEENNRRRSKNLVIREKVEEEYKFRDIWCAILYIVVFYSYLGLAITFILSIPKNTIKNGNYFQLFSTSNIIGLIIGGFISFIYSLGFLFFCHK
ncbi:hypothetical protein AYI70_g3617 [Smittium culicis]|uniref:Uncharacterized protein n=1 Tax=Smittium culicis TaxID=133412 RepID=A0A1R1Y2X4_9FUNG|nr:hypothetical protein AYI70_g3617 [Smittium culicis]